VKRTWKRVVEGASIVGVVASTIHYEPAVVGFFVKLNGWTAMLILCSSALLVGSAFKISDYLNRRFTALDEAQRDALAEAAGTLDRRFTEETTRLDVALQREIVNRAAGDQTDRDRIGRLETRVEEIATEQRRAPRQSSSAKPVAKVAPQYRQ
jgi:hypothetical protein